MGRIEKGNLVRVKAFFAFLLQRIDMLALMAGKGREGMG
jgi:hypothetical protein